MLEYENRIKKVTSSFNSSLDKLTKENEVLKGLIEERDSEIEKLDAAEQRLAQFDTKEDDLKEELSKLQEELKEKKAEIKKIKREREKEQEIMDKYKEDLNNKLNKLTELLKEKEDEKQDTKELYIEESKAPKKEYEVSSKSKEVESENEMKLLKKGIQDAEKNMWIAIIVAVVLAAFAIYRLFSK